MQNQSTEKQLGIWGLTAFYISSIVGVGILIVPGIAYRMAGPASLVSWLLLILVSFPLAYLFSRISMIHPNNGGIAYFVKLRMGEEIGRAAGLLLALTMIVGNPIMGIASARYLWHLLGETADNAVLLATGFIFMLISVLFNLLNIRLNSQIQLGLLGVLLLGLISIIVFAIPEFKMESAVPFAPNGWLSVGTAMVICLYSFLGWENVSTIAEEVRDPTRTYKKAVMISVIAVGFLYIALAASIIFVLPFHKGSDEELAIAQLLTLIFSPQAALFGDAVAILLMVLCTNAWVLSASRFISSLGRDGILPSFINKVSVRTNVPYFALLSLFISYGLVLLLLYWADGSEKELMLFANSSFVLVYLLTFLASLKYFEDPYMNAFAVVSALFSVISLYFIGWMALLPLIILLALIQLFYKRRRSAYDQQNL